MEKAENGTKKVNMLIISFILQNNNNNKTTDESSQYCFLKYREAFCVNALEAKFIQVFLYPFPGKVMQESPVPNTHLTTTTTTQT